MTSAPIPFVVTCLLASVLAFNAPPALADETQDQTLYHELGEEPGLEAITHDLLATLQKDPRTASYFADADLKRLHEKLVEQLCQVSDGPCRYTGRSMQRAHEGLHITRAAFNALVEDLQDVMDQRQIPYHTQNRLLARLAPMVHDIEDR